MFIGTLVHELLQASLRAKASSLSEVKKVLLEDVLKQRRMMQDLLGLGMTSEEAVFEVDPFLPHIVFFIEKYVQGTGGSEPPPAAFGAESRNPPPPSVWPGRVLSVEDIEENIWSPRLGMKGKIDLTVKVRTRGSSRQNGRNQY